MKNFMVCAVVLASYATYSWCQDNYAEKHAAILRKEYPNFFPVRYIGLAGNIVAYYVPNQYKTYACVEKFDLDNDKTTVERLFLYRDEDIKTQPVEPGEEISGLETGENVFEGFIKYWQKYVKCDEGEGVCIKLSLHQK